MSGFPIVTDVDNEVEETIGVAANVVDVVGGTCPCDFTFTVTPLDATGRRWRVAFSNPLQLNPVLEFPGAYFLFESQVDGTPVVGGLQPRTHAVIPENVASPTYVDLVTDEFRINGPFRLRIYGHERA